MKKAAAPDSPTVEIPLQVPVEGTVCNFTTHTQINPITGEVFDFSGNKIYSIPDSEDNHG